MSAPTAAQQVRQDRRDNAGRYSSYAAAEAPAPTVHDVFASATADAYVDAVESFRGEVDLEPGDVAQHLDAAQLLASRIGDHDTVRNRYGFALELADATIGDGVRGGYVVIGAECRNGDVVVLASQQLFTSDIIGDAVGGDAAFDDIGANLRVHRDGLIDAAQRLGLQPKTSTTNLSRLYSRLDASEAKVADELGRQWRAETRAVFPDFDDDTFTLEVGALAARLDQPDRFELGEFIDDGFGFGMDVQHRDDWGVQTGPDRYVFKVAVDDGAGGLVHVCSGEVRADEFTGPLPGRNVVPEGRVAHRLMQVRKQLVVTARRAGLKPWQPEVPSRSELKDLHP